MKEEVFAEMESVDKWSRSKLYTNSFGQGIAMTPMGTIRSLAILANGGHLVTPHVVQKIKYSIGTSKTTELPKFDPEKAVLKESTIEEIRQMLVYNVDHALLDGKRKNPPSRTFGGLQQKLWS